MTEETKKENVQEAKKEVTKVEEAEEVAEAEEEEDIIDPSLSLTGSDVARKMAMALVQINRSQAVDLLISLDYTADEAESKVTEYEAAIEAAKQKKALKGTVDTITASVLEAVREIEIPENVNKLLVSVKYDSSIHAETGKAFGWIVNNPVITPVGSEIAVSFGKAVTAKGGGRGKAKVALPETIKSQGLKSWSAYADKFYPSDVDVKARKSQSVPRWLAAKSDAVFLSAAKVAGISYDENPNGEKVKS